MVSKSTLYKKVRRDLEKFVSKYRPDRQIEYKGHSLYWHYHYGFYFQLQNNLDTLNTKDIKATLKIFSRFNISSKVNKLTKIIQFVLILLFRLIIKNTVSSKKNKVLFVSNPINLKKTNGKTVDTQIQELIERFEAEGFETKTIYMSDLPFKLWFRKKIVPWNFYYIYYRISTFTRKVGEKYYLKHLWENWNLWKSKMEIEPFQNPIEESIYSMMKNIDPRKALRSVMVSELILEYEKPSFVIATNENGSSKYLVTAGNIKKIPTYGVQHGIIHEFHPAYMSPKGFTKVPLVNKFFVFGDYTKRVLTKKSFYQKNSVVVTGDSRLDSISVNPKKEFNTEKFFTRYKIKTNSKLITIISQKSARETIKLFFTDLELLRNEVLFVKLHPRENNDGFYNLLTKKPNQNIIVSKEVDLYELLSASNVVISSFSTVIGEAVVLNKPVIQIKSHIFPEFVDYSSYGVVFAVENKSLLRKKINDVIYKGEKISEVNRKKFISDYYYKIDGESSNRIKNYILGRFGVTND